MSQDLLMEIGCEEIPARFVDEAKEQFAQLTEVWLHEQRITFQQISSFATARRLAIWVKAVAETQADQTEEVRGPAVRIAQTADGDWSPAAQGFARKQGVTADQLTIRDHKGVDYVFAQRRQVGVATTELMAAQFAQVLQQIQFPSTMRWGNKYRFVRPVRWLVVLYGEEVIPLTWVGLTASRMTQGHRFLGQAIELQHAAHYVEQLAGQFVLVDVEERERRISEQIARLAAEQGIVVPMDRQLLREVTHLVEYPTTLLGHFDEAYLSLPKKVLTTTMREHQRYFPVEDQQGALLPHFVTVRNGDDRALQLVQRGNEKVLQARLADAQFFYTEDLKLSLDQAVAKLDRIVFREQLGTIGDRVRRVMVIATTLGQRLMWDDESLRQLRRAAQICKFDLATQMVDEFSKLEGYMGYIYAKQAGEEEQIAQAIYEHHAPRTAHDQPPTDRIGALLALADKIDTVAANFGIGVQPSGSQDPYGLRRKALGIIQILLDRTEFTFTYYDLMQVALDTLEREQLLREDRQEVETALLQFFRLRLRSIQLEQQVRHDVIEALLTNDQDPLAYRFSKADFLMKQVGEDTFKWEVEAYTRAANIVQARDHGAQLVSARLHQPEEKVLYQTLLQVELAIDRADELQDVAAAYTAIRQLAPHIHRFFDHVMVMVEDTAIRENRLALLRRVADCTLRFADFHPLVLL